MGDVNVDIDFRVGKIGPIDSTVKSINSSIRSMFTSTQKLNSAIKETFTDYKETKAQVVEQKQVVAELADELERLQSEHGQFGPTKQFAEMQNQLDSLIEASNELGTALTQITGTTDLQQQLNFANIHPDLTVDFRGEDLGLQDAILASQTLDMSIDGLTDRMARLDAAGKSFEIRDNSAEIEATSSALDDEVASLSNLNSIVSALKAELRGMIPVGLFKNFSLKNIIDQIKKVRDESKKAKSAAENLGSGFKTMLKYAFGVRSMYFLIRKLRSAIIDAYKDMAQINGGANGVNTALSSLVSSLTYLRNAWAAAFSPILTYVAPALSALADMLASVGNAVAHFMAVLTGQKVVVQATKANVNYAASLDKSGNAAGKSAKKNKKNAKSLQDYLNPLDEISKFNKENDNDSGAGGGGGGGGGGLTPDMQFQEVEAKSDWAERLKKAWAEGADAMYDFFYEVGRNCGIKLRDGLNNIPWDKIKKGAKKIAYGIAGFINGFVETPGLWQAVGRTLGEGINTALVFLNSLLKKIHWDSIGKAFSTALQTAFQTINWKGVGEFISNLIIAGLDLIRGLVEGIDWYQLPRDILKAIKDVVTGFNWSGVTSSFFRLAGAIIGGLAAAAVSVAKLIKEKVVNPIINKIKEVFASAKKKGWIQTGKDILNGILEGVKSAIKSIGTWLKKNVFDPFVKGFKSTFKIASPSKAPEIRNVGKFIWEGLLEGMLNAAKNFASWLKNNILTLVSKAFEPIRKIWEGIKDRKAKLDTTWNDFKKKGLQWVHDTWDWFKDKSKKLTTTWKDFAKKSLEWVSSTWKGITSKTDTITTKWSDKIKGGLSALKNLWNGIKSKTIDMITKYKSEGKPPQQAKGGAFYKGAWHKIKQYASGGVPSHGSMFVAGEKGAEVVGHVNGRTEVLNQSQLAAVMKDAIVSAMSVLSGTLVNVANTIISNIGLVRNDLNTLANIMNSVSSVTIPDIALGKIIPSIITVEIKKENMDEFRAMFDDLKNFLQTNENRSNINYEFNAKINRKTLFDEMISEAKLRQQQTGKNPLTAF